MRSFILAGMRSLCRALALALLLAGCREQPEPPPPPAPRPALHLQGETIDLQQAMIHLRTLAAGPRPTGTAAEARAAAYVGKVLAAAGYRVERRPVPLPGGGETANVVALPMGFDPAADRHLLVGGHYDTVVGSPGANDNASGVAVVLEVARALAARPARLPVIFVAFGGEEGRPGPDHQNLVGSRHYARGMSPDEARHLVAMINLDMIAHGDALLSTQRINMKRGVHRRMLALAGRLGVPAREYMTPQVSDSVPFASRGIETGWLWTGVEPAYHSPLDTPEKITPETLDWAGRLTLATIRSYE
ncbi:MAG: M28 family peptidase [Thermoanaerobaculia bacterium]